MQLCSLAKSNYKVKRKPGAAVRREGHHACAHPSPRAGECGCTWPVTCRAPKGEVGRRCAHHRQEPYPTGKSGNRNICSKAIIAHPFAFCKGGCKNFFRRGIRRGKSGRPDRLRLHPPPVSPGLPAGLLAMPLNGSFARPPSVPLARPSTEPLIGGFVGPLIAYRAASPGRSPGSPPDRSGGPPEQGGMESKEF